MRNAVAGGAFTFLVLPESTLPPLISWLLLQPGRKSGLLQGSFGPTLLRHREQWEEMPWRYLAT